MSASETAKSPHCGRIYNIRVAALKGDSIECESCGQRFVVSPASPKGEDLVKEALRIFGGSASRQVAPPRSVKGGDPLSSSKVTSQYELFITRLKRFSGEELSRRELKQEEIDAYNAVSFRREIPRRYIQFLEPKDSI